MKALFAVGLVIGSAASLAAQSHALSHPLGVLPPVRTAGALGGTYVSPVISRPLGGVPIPSFGGTYQKRRNTGAITGGYFGPVYYIPNAFDTSYADASSWAAQQPAPPAAPQQPIVINQYFVTKGSAIPGEMVPMEQPPAPAASEEPAAAPGDLLAPPQNYYLIAYKDHTVYSALTYWLEGDTLHYVTTQNTHNQASLGLIDVDQTYKLNSDRSVPFSIPGK
jgi:hypothetical protein